MRRNKCTLWRPLRRQACLAQVLCASHMAGPASQNGSCAVVTGHRHGQPPRLQVPRAQVQCTVRGPCASLTTAALSSSAVHMVSVTQPFPALSNVFGDRATHLVRATRAATNPREVAVMKLRRPLLCMRQNRNPPPRTEAALLAEKPADICASQGKHGCSGRGAPGDHQQHAKGMTSSSMLYTCILPSCVRLMDEKQARPCQAAEDPQCTTCTIQGGVEQRGGGKLGGQTPSAKVALLGGCGHLSSHAA